MKKMVCLLVMIACMFMFSCERKIQMNVEMTSEEEQNINPLMESTEIDTPIMESSEVGPGIEDLIVGEWQGYRYDNDKIVQDMEGNDSLVSFALNEDYSCNYHMSGIHYSRDEGVWEIHDESLLLVTFFGNDSSPINSDDSSVLYEIKSLTSSELILFINDEYGKCEVILSK